MVNRCARGGKWPPCDRLIMRTVRIVEQGPTKRVLLALASGLYVHASGCYSHTRDVSKPSVIRTMPRKPKVSRVQRKPARAPRASKAVPAKQVAKPSSKPKAAPVHDSAHDPIDTLIGAAAHALSLPIDPSWQPAVKMN